MKRIPSDSAVGMKWIQGAHLAPGYLGMHQHPFPKTKQAWLQTEPN